MKTLLRHGVITLLVLLSSCVPSENPLYLERDLVFDPALLGAWAPPGNEEKENWTFEKSGEKKYKLLITDEKGRVAEFEAHLAQLKKERFLDLYLVKAGEGELTVNEYAGFDLIIRPGHMFLKVWQIEPTLKLAFLNADWLNKFLEKNPKALRHERGNLLREKSDESIVITAKTKEIRAFIGKNSKEAFGEPEKGEGFIRKK